VEALNDGFEPAGPGEFTNSLVIGRKYCEFEALPNDDLYFGWKSLLGYKNDADGPLKDWDGPICDVNFPNEAMHLEVGDEVEFEMLFETRENPVDSLFGPMVTRLGKPCLPTGSPFDDENGQCFNMFGINMYGQGQGAMSLKVEAPQEFSFDVSRIEINIKEGESSDVWCNATFEPGCESFTLSDDQKTCILENCKLGTKIESPPQSSTTVEETSTATATDATTATTTETTTATATGASTTVSKGYTAQPTIGISGARRETMDSAVVGLGAVVAGMAAAAFAGF
jgi:hypothetical protein